MRVNLVAGVKEEVKKNKTYFFVLKIYEGELDSKTIQQPFPGNGARNACWYFLTFTDKIRKRMKNTVVAIHLESIQGIVFTTGNGGVTVF